MCETCENEEPNLQEIWAAADKKAKDWREAGEEKLLRQMLDARDAEVRRKVFKDILDDDTQWIDLEEFMAWVRRMAEGEK